MTLSISIIQLLIIITRMSELPLIGFLNLYKDFWDRLGANIATR